MKKRIVVARTAWVAVCAVVLLAGCQQAGRTGPTPPVSEGSQTLETSQTLADTVNGRRLVSRIDPSWRVSQEGKNWGQYYFVDLFSPDGRHVAYMAGRDGKLSVILDRTAGPPYDSAYPYVFSSDSRRFVYVASAKGDYFAVLDGVEGKHYEAVIPPPNTIYASPSSIAIPVFSPDSKHVAYVAEADGKDRLVMDGVEGKLYDSISYDTRSGDPGIVFSPDSRRVAYVASTARSADGTRQQFSVIDGVEGKRYSLVSGIVFSPDSTRVAYVAGPYFADLGGIYYAVIDGVEQPQEGVYRVTFSPDSRRVAYAAHPSKGGSYVVVDGVAGKTYDSITDPVFSPDSRHVAYAARSAGGWVMVIDGQEGKPYDQTGGVVFSPDGNHMAYEARNGADWFVVLDGAEGKRYERVSNLLFSPDSKRFSYVSAAQGLGTCAVVLDGVEGKTYRFIYQQPAFSPGSKHLAYSAQDGTGERVIVDGVEGERYDHVLGGLEKTSLMFDSPSSLHYLAESGRDIYLVEEKVE